MDKIACNVIQSIVNYTLQTNKGIFCSIRGMTTTGICISFINYFYDFFKRQRLIG